MSYSNRDLFRIRLGLACLVIPAIFTVIGLHFRGPIVDPAKLPELFVQVSTSGTHYLAWTFLLPSLVIQCFGWLALYHWLRDTPQERLAFWATMLSIAGNLLFLPSVGVLAFMSEVASAQHLAGNAGALPMIVAGIQGEFALPFLMGSGLVLLAGVLLFTAVLWTSPKLPRWTAIPYLLHALFLTIVAPQSYVLERTGGWLLLVVTAAIVWRVWKDTSRVRDTGRVAAAAG